MTVEIVLPHFVDVDCLLEAGLILVDAAFQHLPELTVVFHLLFTVNLQIRVHCVPVLVRETHRLVKLVDIDSIDSLFHFV